jgi:hypothetical protein
MNILLWVLQVLLALWNLIGGSFVIMNFEKIGNPWALGSFSQPAWVGLGAIQVFYALGLLWPKTAALAAVVLALVSLSGLAIYTQYAGFPGLLWGVVPALLLAFVAYGRFTPRPKK